MRKRDVAVVSLGTAYASVMGVYAWHCAATGRAGMAAFTAACLAFLASGLAVFVRSLGRRHR